MADSVRYIIKFITVTKIRFLSIGKEFCLRSKILPNLIDYMRINCNFYDEIVRKNKWFISEPIDLPVVRTFVVLRQALYPLCV